MTQATPGSAMRRRWVRAIRIRRRWLAALLAGTATLVGLQVLAPPAPPTRPVVIASRDLAPGELLEPEDLTVVEWPTALAPASAFGAVSGAAGRQLAGAVGRGEAVTALRLVGARLAQLGAAAGRVVAPVRLADAAAAQLLVPGDLVDLVGARAGAADPISGSGASGATTLASRARVLAVPARPVAGLGAAEASSGALVVLSVTRSEALALAAAAVLGPLSVVLVG